MPGVGGAKVTRFLGSLFVLAVVSGCAARSASEPARIVYVASPPPRPLVEDPSAPSDPEAIWVAGYWHWNGVRYVWVPGHWEKAQVDRTWQPPMYSFAGGRWSYRPGQWALVPGAKSR